LFAPRTSNSAIDLDEFLWFLSTCVELAHARRRYPVTEARLMELGPVRRRADRSTQENPRSEPARDDDVGDEEALITSAQPTSSM
jgi:hypothetical protein